MLDSREYDKFQPVDSFKAQPFEPCLPALGAFSKSFVHSKVHL